MCTVLLPPGGYPIAFNTYIISYLFSDTFSLCSSVNVEGHVSDPYAASGVIIVPSLKRPSKQYVENNQLVIENKTLM